jgi:hypothetical protein
MTSGRRCLTCSHPKSLEINEALMSNQKVSAISRRYGIPSDALFRHVRNHLSTVLDSADRLDFATVLPTLTRRVLDIADAHAAARETARANGQTAQAARLGDAELRAITVLTQRLGIDDEDIAEQLELLPLLARAVGSTVREQPGFGYALAERLRAYGADDLAQDIEEHAARSAENLELTT